MTKKGEVYKCELCGNIVEVLHEGFGGLVCCGELMHFQKENSEGKYAEKHAPVVEEVNEKFLIKVGKIEHPMQIDHYIEWIEAISETGEKSRVFLNPEDKSQAEFSFKPVKAGMYCNIHGLWAKK